MDTMSNPPPPTQDKHQPNSLEFIEDPYLPTLPAAATPSLDDLNAAFDDRLLFDDATTAADYDDDGLQDGHAAGAGGQLSMEWSPETELYLRQMPLEQIFCISDDRDGVADGDDEESVDVALGAIDHRNKMSGSGPRVATSTSGAAMSNSGSAAAGGTPASGTSGRDRTQAFLQRLFGRKSLGDVRVSFSEMSKGLLKRKDGSEKLSDNSPGAASTSSFESAEFAHEFSGLSHEEQERLRAEWNQELARVEEEITTLRTVLASKMRLAAELKRKLGITVWKEISEDMNQGIRNVRESTVYQKTASAISTTAEKTTSIFGGLTSGLSSRLTQMKKSESYKSLAENVDSAYQNVKTKVVTSRAGSVDGGSSHLDSRGSTAPQSPTIPEGHALP